MSERIKITLLLAPALLVIGVLFVGGLAAAFTQSLGYLPAIGMTELNLDAYREVLRDGDFLDSLVLTLYIAGASTGISTVLAV
ncbi:MAG: ABC transporter permease, partial [Rubrobacteraceae bacterium]